MKRTDPRPEDLPPDEAELLDLALGQADPDQAERLRLRLAREPGLAARQARLEALLAAERSVFEPAARTQALEADAARVAAWVRHEAGRSPARTAPGARARALPRRQRRWARVLAFSVALHVAVLGVLAWLGRGESTPGTRPGARVRLEADAGFRETEADYAGTEVALRYQSIAFDDLGDMSDRLLLAEQDVLEDELPDLDLPPIVSPRPLLDHPVDVVVPMSRRRLPALKRRRLRLLGFNAEGTLLAVDRGLRFLAGEQARTGDGSFDPGGGRGRLEQTALATLAFLSNGHSSADRGRGPGGTAVARAVHWMRGQLFGADAAPVGPQRGTAELGLAAMALCEDYMLAYGWLPPAAAQERAAEIAQLAAGLRMRVPDDPAGADAEAPWAVWALDAAARAGVIERAPDTQSRFDAWVARAAVQDQGPDALSPLHALSVGTALLYEERGPAKPRFVAWSHANAQTLVERLGPIGSVREGDRIGDTALVLLALQVTWRTY